MNEIAPFEGKPLAKNTLQSRLQRFKQTRPTSSDGSIFLKMAKDGEWSYGAEEEVPEDDSKWAINPNSIQQGYICWPTAEDARGGGPVAEQMYDAGADIPFITEMPHHEDCKWTDQLSINMKCISGEDKDLEVVYKTNSKSGVAELNNIIDAIVEQMEDGGAPIPVVHLRNDHYRHKKYGKIYTPVLDIVNWMGVPSTPESEDDDEPEAPKASKRTRKAKEEVEPEEEAPKTRSRRKAKTEAAPADDDGDDDGGGEPEADAEPAPTRRRRRS